MRQHENRLRRALLARNEERIQKLRESTTDVVKPHDLYVQAVAQIQELKRMSGEISEICERILEEEDDDE